MQVILAYDISTDDKGKTIAKIFKICKKYLFQVQNSVFEGEITEGRLSKLKKELEKHLREDKDSIVIFTLNTGLNLKKEFLGIKKDFDSRFL